MPVQLIPRAQLVPRAQPVPRTRFIPGSAIPLDSGLRIQRPAIWAPAALRLCLGLAGTLLTTLALWSLTPPPL